MAPIEEPQTQLGVHRLGAAELLDRLSRLGRLPLQLGRFRGVRRFVDRAGQVGVQEPILHRGQFRDPFGQRGELPLLGRSDVGESLSERFAEPGRDLRRGKLQSLQILDDRNFQVGGAPADLRVIGTGIVVGAAIVDVLPDAAAFQLAADLLARDGLAAVGAREQATRVRQVGTARAAVLPAENVLAGVECHAIDESLVFALVNVPVAMQFADVEPIVQDVRQRRAVESWHRLAIDVPFVSEAFGQRFERQIAQRVQLEDPHHRLRFDRIGLHGFVAILDVDVSVGGEARWPALLDLLVHPLEHFGPQVVAVILGDGGHHVERECAGRTGTELVIDKRQMDAAGVLEFLQPHGVPHVATDAIQFVADDRSDPFAPGVGPNPFEHLVEGDPLRAPFGGLGHHELPHAIPARLLRSFARGTELRVD